MGPGYGSPNTPVTPVNLRSRVFMDAHLFSKCVYSGLWRAYARATCLDPLGRQFARNQRPSIGSRLVRRREIDWERVWIDLKYYAFWVAAWAMIIGAVLFAWSETEL